MKFITVQTKAELHDFITFPWKIYAGDPLWVPQLIEDYVFTMTGQNPFWEHAEKEFYICYNDAGEPVGRIAAIIDHNYIKFQDESCGFFGFFECINDASVAKALLDKVRNWLHLKGVKLMRGPMNPSTNDECGFLCEGFDSAPRLMMPYNPPYYLSLMEQAGLNKAKELYAYDMDVTEGPIKRLERLAEIARKKLPGLTVKPFKLSDFKNEIHKAVQVYNAAWEKNWGFVPWTEKEFYTIANKLKDLLLLETTLLAEINGRPVGMLIAVPDYNLVMQKMNGKLWPFGIFKFLWYRRKIKALRLMIMGVVKDFRQKGIEGVMYYESLKSSQKLGYTKCEFSWILDDNVLTQRAAEMMGGKLYKKYRIYETNV
jgi:GNAT superfamily N-acetyltransferase